MSDCRSNSSASLALSSHSLTRSKVCVRLLNVHPPSTLTYDNSIVCSTSRNRTQPPCRPFEDNSFSKYSKLHCVAHRFPNRRIVSETPPSWRELRVCTSCTERSKAEVVVQPASATGQLRNSDVVDRSFEVVRHASLEALQNHTFGVGGCFCIEDDFVLRI